MLIKHFPESDVQPISAALESILELDRLTELLHTAIDIQPYLKMKPKPWRIFGVLCSDHWEVWKYPKLEVEAPNRFKWAKKWHEKTKKLTKQNDQQCWSF